MTRNMTNMILTAGLSALLGTTILGAQSLSEMANIPFTFHSEQQTFAAGQYRVSERGSNGIFQLYGPDQKSIYVSASVPVTVTSAKPHLTFTCSGGECVLSEIAMPGRDVAYRVSKSKIDKNLSHKLGIATMISVPLKAH